MGLARLYGYPKGPHMPRSHGAPYPCECYRSHAGPHGQECIPCSEVSRSFHQLITADWSAVFSSMFQVGRLAMHVLTGRELALSMLWL
jgi:hypothetical protein